MNVLEQIGQRRTQLAIVALSTTGYGPLLSQGMLAVLYFENVKRGLGEVNTGGTQTVLSLHGSYLAGVAAPARCASSQTGQQPGIGSVANFGLQA